VWSINIHDVYGVDKVAGNKKLNHETSNKPGLARDSMLTSVCLFVTRVDQSKTVEVRITVAHPSSFCG